METASPKSNTSSDEQEIKNDDLPLQLPCELENVFQNQLLTEFIASFLPFSDMEQFRLAGTLFNTQMINSLKFMKTAQIHICDDSNDVIRNQNVWKNVKIALEVDLLSLHQNLLASVSSVLVYSSSYCLTDYFFIDLLEQQIVNDFLNQLMDLTPFLRKLTLESSVWKINLTDFLLKPDNQALLSGLDEFQIIGSRHFAPNKTFYLNLLEIQNDPNDIVPYRDNFRNLATIPFRKLTKLVIAKSFIFGNSLMNHIPSVIERCKTTLEHLSVHLTTWHFEDMSQIICNRLRTLQLSAAGIDATIVQLFIENHLKLHLEELEISIEGLFPIILLETIRDKGKRLKKLHITAKRLVLSERDDDIWIFLEEMEYLEDFVIQRPFYPNSNEEWRSSGINFLTHLQNRHTLISLLLRGLTEFWNQRNQDLRNNIQGQINLFHGFKNITNLSLLRCPEALCDQTLQYIFKNFDKLLKFGISQSNNITTIGFTGVGANEDGTNSQYNIQSLKHLTHLLIKDCIHITPGLILQWISFPFLREFEFIGLRAFTQQETKTIAQQNPSIVSLTLQILSENTYEFRKFRDEITTANTRLKHIIELTEGDHEVNDNLSDAGVREEDIDQAVRDVEAMFNEEEEEGLEYI